MTDLTNAQLALQCAVKIIGEKSYARVSVITDYADQFKKWLDDNSPVELKK